MATNVNLRERGLNLRRQAACDFERGGSTMPGDDGGRGGPIDQLDTPFDLGDLYANRFGLGTIQTGLFPGQDRRATTSSALHSRSESVIAINPLDELNMVGASKRFIEPAKYHFKLGPIYTFDGGGTWHESTLPMEEGWDGMTDPTVAFDTFGHAFLVGEPLKFDPSDVHGLGMAVYRSSDCGVTWEKPFRLTTTTSDDKQWVLCDNNPGSPHYGNVYVAWAACLVAASVRAVDRPRGNVEREGERSARHHPDGKRVRSRHLDLGRRDASHPLAQRRQ